MLSTVHHWSFLVLALLIAPSMLTPLAPTQGPSGHAVVVIDTETSVLPEFDPAVGGGWGPSSDVGVGSSRAIADSLIPKPQHLDDKGFNITIDLMWGITVETSDQNYSFAATWFNKKVNTTAPLTLPVYDATGGSPVTKRILIGNPADPHIKEAFERRNRTLPTGLGDEGYLLEVFNDAIQEVIIAANKPNGTFYGVDTLIQLIAKDRTLPGVLIVDFPEHKMRGTYQTTTARMEWLSGPGKYNFTQGYKDFIDWLASMKFNTFMPLEHALFWRPESVWVQAYSELFNYSRQRFIEPIPRLSSISTISGYPFDYWEGWYIKDVNFTFNGTDEAVADSPAGQLVLNGDFEVDANSDGRPDNWTATNTSGSTWTIDNTTFASGSHSMRLDIATPDPTSNSAVLSTSILGIEPDSYYCIWAKARGQNIQSVQAQLTFYVVNMTGGVAVLQSDTTYSTSGWVDFGTCIKTPGNPKQINLYSRIQYPGTGTFWLDNVTVMRVDGGLRNVIRSTDTDIRVTNMSKSTTYVLGTDYTVVNGTTNGKYTPSLVPFKVQRLPGGNIAPGQQVLISYDTYLFSHLLNYWSSAPCVAKEELYTVLITPAVDKMVTYLHPRIINIDLDEIRGFYRDSRSTSKFASPGEAIAYYANRVDGIIRARDPSILLWAWDDMVSPYHNGGDPKYQVSYGGGPGRMAESTEKDWLNKTVIMDIWWYGDSWLPQMEATIDYFNEKGYKVMGSPWYDEQNIISWSELLLDQPNSLGGIETDWGTPWEGPHRLFIDNFWNTRYRVLLFDSFEKDSNGDGMPDGWTGSGPTLYSTNGTKQQGTRYASFPNCAIGFNSSNVGGFSSATFPVRPNTTYSFSAYIKSDSTSTEKPGMRIVWLDGQGDIASVSIAFPEGVTTTYQLFYLNATSPAGTATAYLVLSGQAGGSETFWFDTVRFREETVFLGIIGPYDLDEALVNHNYSARLEAVGGLGPYDWSIASGILPRGLTLDQLNGTITGSPQAPGLFNMTFRVTDRALRTAERNLSLFVRLKDLSFRSVNITDGPIMPGEWVWVNATVQKQGDWDVAPGSIDLVLLFDGANYTTVPVSLGNGTEKTVPLMWTAPSDPGDYNISVVIDPDDKFEESFEDNNTYVATVHVTRFPDISITNLSTEPSPVHMGETLTVKAELALTTELPLTGSVAVELLVDNVKVTSTDLALDNVTVVNVTFGWGAVYGTHGLTLQVDPGGAIRESDETNNAVMTSVRVYALPDLAIADAYVSPLAPVYFEGDNVTIIANITATSELPLNENISVELITENVTVGTRDLVFGTGTSAGVSFDVILSAGDSLFEVAVNRDGRIKEADRTNNGWEIPVSAFRLPDLWLYDMVPSEAVPTEGENVTINITIMGNMELPISEPFDIELDVDGVAIGTIGAYIGDGKGTVVSFAWTAVNGTHDLTAYMDRSGSIRESNKENNQINKTILVKARPIDDGGDGDGGNDSAAMGLWPYLWLVIAVIIAILVIMLLVWRKKSKGEGEGGRKTESASDGGSGDTGDEEQAPGPPEQGPPPEEGGGTALEELTPQPTGEGEGAEGGPPTTNY